MIFYFPNFLNTGLGIFYDVIWKGIKRTSILKSIFSEVACDFWKLGRLWIQFRFSNATWFQNIQIIHKEAKEGFWCPSGLFSSLTPNWYTNKWEHLLLVFFKLCSLKKVSGKMGLNPGFKISWFIQNFLSLGQFSENVAIYKIQSTVKSVYIDCYIIYYSNIYSNILCYYRQWKAIKNVLHAFLKDE